MTKAQQGGLLVALGVLGAFVTFFVRSNDVREHEAGQLSDRYANAMLSDDGSTARVAIRGAFDNSPYLIAGAVCVLLIVCGAILYASRRDTTA